MADIHEDFGHTRPAPITAQLDCTPTIGVRQRNGRGNHPQTQGKVERFQQTLKKRLTQQPTQPATIADLQTVIDQFRHGAPQPPPAPPSQGEPPE